MIDKETPVQRYRRRMGASNLMRKSLWVPNDDYYIDKLIEYAHTLLKDAEEKGIIDNVPRTGKTPTKKPHEPKTR